MFTNVDIKTVITVNQLRGGPQLSSFSLTIIPIITFRRPPSPLLRYHHHFTQESNLKERTSTFNASNVIHMSENIPHLFTLYLSIILNVSKL